MKLSDFDFLLPEELIAQQPPPERGESRMMILYRNEQRIEHSDFRKFPEFIERDDVIVINVTRVIKARLIGRRPTGGKVEILLLKRIEENLWEALGKPGRRLRKGTRIIFAPGEEATIEDESEMGKRKVRFHFEIEKELDKIGRVPLPPYIRREPSPEDEERYQTIFAKEGRSVAAPTAGLHFSEEILKKVKEKATVVEIIHNVGEATFRPLQSEKIEENKLPEEEYYISPQTSQELKRAVEQGRRIIAIGTTVVRALESAFSHDFSPGHHKTDLFIYPGYEFKVVKAMLTNFHLPRSSLVLLVSAFAGREFLLKAYKEAIEKRYRFYSYGDCMLIL